MAEVESTTFSWFLQEKTFFEDSKMALKFSTVLKFSTGANDSLHPKLVKAGFTPESATAILEGKPLQGFGYPGFTVSPRIYLESQWRRDNAGELAADTALPETDPDVAALNVESQPESATGACGQTGETGYRFRDRARTLFDAGFEPIPIKRERSVRP